MRKCLCVLLSLVLILVLMLCGCVPADQAEGDTVPENEGIQAEGMTDQAEALLEEALDNVDELEEPVREYGESYGFSQMDGILLTHILYPVGELETMNAAIENWIDEQVAYYEEDAKDYVHGEQKAELTVGYESRIIDEKLISVRMTGYYEAPFMAHPIDIVKTFNGSLETGKMIELAELLEEGGAGVLMDMAAEDAGVDKEMADEGLLNHWHLTAEGLEFNLVRGDYLPMSEGTRLLRYTYEDLKGILDLSKISADQQLTPENQDIPDSQQPEITPPADLPDPNKPMLALTFDDGPSAHTDRLLDTFEEHGGKGTFFVVGNMINKRQETLVRMAEAGHEIGGHSWNHRQLTTLEEEEMQKQLLNTRAKIYKVTGVDATLMRPPYGSFNDEVKEMCKDHGIAMINWSVDTLDWKYRDADTVYKAVMSKAKDGAIILCHDLHGSTVDAMERAIPDLIEEGYQLVTVTQLLTSQGDEIKAGKVYYNRR